MSLEADFERARARVLAGTIPTDAFVTAAFPNEEDRAAFIDWSLQKSREREAKRQRTWEANHPKFDLQAFQRLLSDYNFITDDKLCNALVRSPPFVIGREAVSQTLLRICPTVLGLEADIRPKDGDCPCTCDAVLAIELENGVSSGSSSGPLMSSHSNDKNNCFVFHHFGKIEALRGTTVSDPEGPAGNQEHWDDTDFNAVIRFERDGRANGIYIIYNSWVEVEDYAPVERYRTRDSGSLPVWADGKILDSSHGLQFSCAKIADSINDFPFAQPFSLKEVVQHPVKLTTTVRVHEGDKVYICPITRTNQACELVDHYEV